VREVFVCIARRRENHLEAEDEQNDAARDLNGIVCYMEKVHQSIAQIIEEDDHKEGDEKLADDHNPLSFGGQIFEKADVQGDVSDRIHQEKEGEGDRKETHEFAY